MEVIFREKFEEILREELEKFGIDSLSVKIEYVSDNLAL
jgi:hypothetical protein